MYNYRVSSGKLGICSSFYVLSIQIVITHSVKHTYMSSFCAVKYEI